MKKQKRVVKIGSNKEHSKAMLRNLACSLIFHEAIETTKPRSRAVRSYVERLITISKKDNLASKRLIFDRLRNKKATKKLVADLTPRFEDRVSGFVRIYKSLSSKGDNAEVFSVSFVDYAPRKKKSTRTKKSKKQQEDKKKKTGLIDRVKGGFRRGGRKGEESRSQVLTDTDKSKAKSRSGI